MIPRAPYTPFVDASHIIARRTTCDFLILSQGLTSGLFSLKTYSQSLFPRGSTVSIECVSHCNSNLHIFLHLVGFARTGIFTFPITLMKFYTQILFEFRSEHLRYACTSTLVGIQSSIQPISATFNSSYRVRYSHYHTNGAAVTSKNVIHSSLFLPQSLSLLLSNSFHNSHRSSQTHWLNRRIQYCLSEISPLLLPLTLNGIWGTSGRLVTNFGLSHSSQRGKAGKPILCFKNRLIAYSMLPWFAQPSSDLFFHPEHGQFYDQCFNNNCRFPLTSLCLVDMCIIVGLFRQTMKSAALAKILVSRPAQGLSGSSIANDCMIILGSTWPSS